jgi:hypothetical protein
MMNALVLNFPLILTMARGLVSVTSEPWLFRSLNMTTLLTACKFAFLLEAAQFHNSITAAIDMSLQAVTCRTVYMHNPTGHAPL